jgi:pimeloyl-ACP methyl ester carboxylesterase
MLLNISEAGHGNPIVLLHGLFGRAQNLGHVARRLAKSARVISMDLRNHGASAHADGMDYETLAGDVMQTMSALTISAAALLGHSMGGKTAMAAALLSPSRVTRLLVADIAPVTYAHNNTSIVTALQTIPLRPGLTRAEAGTYLQSTIADPAIRNFLLQNLQFGETPAWRIALPEIAAAIADLESWPSFPPGTRYAGPTLFIRGANSDYIQQQYHPAIEALFPNARYVTLAHAAHWLHADQPEAFADAAEAFLLAA